MCTGMFIAHVMLLPSQVPGMAHCRSNLGMDGCAHGLQGHCHLQMRSHTLVATAPSAGKPMAEGITPELYSQIEVQASRVMRAVEAPAGADQHAREVLQLTAGPLIALVRASAE